MAQDYLITMLVTWLQIRVADSAAVPFVLHRGGVLESVAVRATPRFGPADNEPRFSNVAIRRVFCTTRAASRLRLPSARVCLPGPPCT